MNKRNGVGIDSRDRDLIGFDGYAIGKMYVTDGECIVDDEIRAVGAVNGWVCMRVGLHRFLHNCHSRGG